MLVRLGWIVSEVRQERVGDKCFLIEDFSIDNSFLSPVLNTVTFNMTYLEGLNLEEQPVIHFRLLMAGAFSLSFGVTGVLCTAAPEIAGE